MCQDDPQLPPQAMSRLSAEIRSMTDRMSREQMLDLADLLHEVIRERQFQEVGWRRRVASKGIVAGGLSPS